MGLVGGTLVGTALGILPATGGSSPFSIVNHTGFVATPGGSGNGSISLGYTTTPGNYFLCVIFGDNSSSGHGVFEFTPSSGSIYPTDMAVGSAAGTSTILDVVRSTGAGNQSDLLFGIAEIEGAFSAGTLFNSDNGIACFIEVRGLSGAPLIWNDAIGNGTSTPANTISGVSTYRRSVAFAMMCSRTNSGGSLATPDLGEGWTQIQYQSGSGGFIGAYVGYQIIPARTSTSLTFNSSGSTVPSGDTWDSLIHVIS